MSHVIKMQQAGQRKDLQSLPLCPWGLYDTADNCWMGDDEGPKIFSADVDLENLFASARIAAQIVDVRLGQKPGRTMVRHYPAAATRLRDKVEPKMSAEDALRGLEDGRFI